MSEPLLSVTIIVAARPEEIEIPSVIAARRLDYPPDKLQIIVARGKQPSVQRNAAIRAARGELVYFLDDDSVAPSENLQRAVKLFADAKVKMVGGPNLCPPDAPKLEQIFALTLASWLAFATSRARYSSVGKIRAAGEKELILCNLIARRGDLLELGGFNELLYPNEENALMDELQKRGGRLIYDPQFIVHRRPRRNFKSFCKMLFTYGRGRAEQFRVNPTFGSAMNFVPPLFCVYLLAAIFASVFLPPRWLEIFLAPLALYVFAVILQTLALIPLGGLVKSFYASPFIVLTHLLYGLGFCRGLFTKLKTGGERPKILVVLETIQP